MPIDFTTILNALQAARATAERYSDLPLKSALLELYDKILSAKEHALTLQEELHASRRKVMELEAALSHRKSDPRQGLTFDKGVWWASETRDHSELGPFCPNCLDDGERRLLKSNHSGSGQCMKCENWFHSILPNEHPVQPDRHPRRSWMGDIGY